MSFFQAYYKKIGIPIPAYHFVLGSGFSALLDQVKNLNLFNSWEESSSCFFSEIPGLPKPSIDSHDGLYRFFINKASGLSISFQCGRLHLYEGCSVEEVIAPVIQIRMAGTKNFVLSNLSGGLKKEHRPGTVIALKDHVNMTGFSPLVGPEKQDGSGNQIGPRFPDMSDVYDLSMREELSSELLNLAVRVCPGIYVGVLGPELETPAQIEWLNRSSGGLFDVVGMSTVLEAIALKQSGAKLGALSLVSNWAAGLDPQNQELSFEEMCQATAPYILKVLQACFSYSEKKLAFEKNR